VKNEFGVRIVTLTKIASNKIRSLRPHKELLPIKNFACHPHDGPAITDNFPDCGKRASSGRVFYIADVHVNGYYAFPQGYAGNSHRNIGN